MIHNAGEYDYDENERLPSGCKFEDNDLPPSVRDEVKGLRSAPPAPAPSPTGADLHSALSAPGSPTTAPSGGIAAIGAPIDQQQAKALKVKPESRDAPIAAVGAPAGSAQNETALQNGTAGRTLKSAASGPTPVKAPNNATWVAAKQAAIFLWPGNYPDGFSHGLMTMRCKPVPARSPPSPPPKDSHNKVGTYFLYVAIVLNFVSCSAFCLLNIRQNCFGRNPRAAPGG